ncbi:hypothetical protein [Nonomuraea fuscirosea]|uniref:hypothetical protein n=1 Tax=Nonomuraea fuscirosea TaxID=1291556 RepID=UPI00343C156B
MTQTAPVYTVQVKCLAEDNTPWHLPGLDETAKKGEKVTLDLTAGLFDPSHSADYVPAIECEVLAGFKSVKTSLDALVADNFAVYFVNETDPLHQRLTIYLNEIVNRPTEFAFQIERAQPVRDLRPATINISESYGGDVGDSVMYPAP